MNPANDSYSVFDATELLASLASPDNPEDIPTQDEIERAKSIVKDAVSLYSAWDETDDDSFLIPPEIARLFMPHMIKDLAPDEMKELLKLNGCSTVDELLGLMD